MSQQNQNDSPKEVPSLVTTKPSPPKNSLKLIVVMILGLGLSLAIFQIKNPSSQTAPSPDDVFPDRMKSASTSADQQVFPAKTGQQTLSSGEKGALDSLLTPAVPQLKTPPTELPSHLDPQAVESILLMQAKYATGDFDGALTIAEMILTQFARDRKMTAYVESQLPAILVSAGWSHIRFGRCEKAIDLLTRSRQWTSMAEATKGLALCYYKLRRILPALDETESYLNIDPSDEAMLVIVSDLYESQSRFQEALDALKKAEQTLLNKVSTTPISSEERTEVESNLATVRQQKRNMSGRSRIAINQRSEHSGLFKLSYSEVEHDLLAGWVLNTLQDTLDALTGSYGFRPPEDAIEVILYEQKDFQQAHQDAPHWVDGLFNGRIRVPIKSGLSELAQKKHLQKVLSHELVHALFAGATGHRNLPPWFDEGMAQRVSCLPVSCKPFAFQANPGSFLASDEFQKSFLNANSLKAQRLYQQSLYLVMTLEFIGGPETLRLIIEHIKADSKLDSDSLLKPVGLTFNELREKAAELWKKSAFSSSYDP